jgi:hypothetical protein
LGNLSVDRSLKTCTTFWNLEYNELYGGDIQVLLSVDRNEQTFLPITTTSTALRFLIWNHLLALNMESAFKMRAEGDDGDITICGEGDDGDTDEDEIPPLERSKRTLL